MPGLLTPERRQRVKQRSRNPYYNKGPSTGSKKKKSPLYHKLSPDKNAPQSSLNVDSTPDSRNNGITVQPRTITPTAGIDRSSPRDFKSGWGDDDEVTAASTAAHSSMSSMSMGSPASYARGVSPRYSYGSSGNASYSILEDSVYVSDEEMPMDELMGTRKQKEQNAQNNQSRDHNLKRNSRNTLSSTNTRQESSVATYRSVTPTKEVSDVLGLSNIMAMVSPSNWNNTSCNDINNSSHSRHKRSISMDSNRLNGKSALSSTTGIQRIIAALNSGSTACRPPHLNREECILWDSLQTAMTNDRNEQLSKQRALERDLQNSSFLMEEVSIREKELEKEVTEANTIRADMEHKYAAMSIVLEKQETRKINKETQKNSGENEVSKREMLNLQLQQIELLKQELQAKEMLMKEQEDSHNTEVLAIQRVLADVTTEKIKLEATVEKKQQQEISKAAVPNNEGVDRDNNEPDDVKEKIEGLQEEIKAAVREASTKSEQIMLLESDLKKVTLKLNDTVEENEKLVAENKATADQLAKLSKKDDLERDEQSKAAVEELKAELSFQKLETENLRVEMMEAQVAQVSALDEVKKLKTKNELAHQDLEKSNLERDQAVNEVEKLKKEKEITQEEVEKLKKEHQDAANELDELRRAREQTVDEVDRAIMEAKAIEAQHPPMISPSSSSGSECSSHRSVSYEEFEKLKQRLSETVSSLETSKQIIASLENANGSLAVDSRTRLKDKGEELSMVQKESEERKRNLDSLATELRDLQRKHADFENADKRTAAQVIRQKALMDHLETTLSDLQSAVIVHESSVTMMESDISRSSNIEEISEILADALHAISATVETSEQYIDEFENSSGANTNVEYGEVSSHSDEIILNDREPSSRELKHELEQKKVAVKRLEETLKLQNEDMRKMRHQFFNADNTNQLRSEIQRLRQQSITNMEVLAKKERELSVLRSSLKVDENETGYISDDASDDEDDDTGTDVGSIMSAAKLNAYGPADAEAFATILSQSTGRIELPGNAQMQEIESLKRDLMEALGEKESASKELQARRESLANAKMIISSLEKANKGMMEDLRSRLEDSNAAISSLLNKSKDNEKVADDLRENLQKLEQEKLEERERYEAELKELRNRGSEVSLEEKKE